MTHEKTDTATAMAAAAAATPTGCQAVARRRVEGEDRDDGANALLKRKPLDKLTHLLYQEWRERETRGETGDGRTELMLGWWGG